MQDRWCLRHGKLRAHADEQGQLTIKKRQISVNKFSGALALLVIGNSVAVQAQTILETQVVTASKSQTKLENMALNTTLITQEDIKKSAAQTLDQLLRDVPGFQFTGIPSTQSDPTGHQTKLRGLGNSKVLVLVDGIPVHDPFYVTTQWFKVPLSNIERVEVVRGGSSSLWGNMAVAGVVNIITKKSVDNSGEVRVSYGSRGSSEVALSKNFSESEALGYNITVEQLNSKGYLLPPSQYAWMYPGRGPVNSKDTNVQFSTYFKPSNDLSGFVKLGYHIQDQDISYQFGNNLQKSPDISAGLTKKLEDDASISANAWSQYVSFEKYNGTVCAMQGVGATACKDPTTLTQSQLNGSQLVQLYSQYGSQQYRESGASAIYNKNVGGLVKDYQFGVDFRRLSAKDAETFYQSSQNGINPSNPQVLASSTYGEGVQSFQGLFAQTKLLPTEDLELTLSARADSYANTDMYTSRTTSANVTSGGARADKSKTAFDPSVAAKYFVDDNLSLRGAAYKAFRAPGFNNLLRTYGTTPTIANPDLDPETLLGKEIGLDYRTEDVYLGATYFDYKINNMIATYTVTSYATAPAVVQNICGVGLSNCNSAGNPKYYTNDQNGASNGYELIGKWKLNSQYTFNASYTFTSTYLTSHGSIVTDPLNTQLAGVPKQTAVAGLTWVPSNKIRLYGQARYIGRFYIDTTSAGAPYAQGGNVIYDASASYAWDKDTDITLSALNLANREYNEGAYTYNKPWTQTMSLPRTVNLAVRVRF